MATHGLMPDIDDAATRDLALDIFTRMYGPAEGRDAILQAIGETGVLASRPPNLLQTTAGRAAAVWTVNLNLVARSQQHLRVDHETRVVDNILHRASGKADVGVALDGGDMERREQGDRKSEQASCECKNPAKASEHRNRNQPPVNVRTDYKSTAMPSRIA